MNSRSYFVSLSALALMSVPAHAAVIASTTFDGQTIAGNTASDLGWVLNGVDDPGNMPAFNAAAAPQNLFNANALVQNIFIPGINVGNGNTFWTTDVSLTVSAGSTVTLTDVTFNSVSVNGGQAENVNRGNDYTVFLFSPLNAVTPVAEVTVADTLAGTVAGQPLVTLDLADTALTDVGTYTLRIKGGDFSGLDETGNHAGINNLSINGDVSAVPEPSALLLGGLGFLTLLRRRRSGI
jgi:MYXO-CTERM domain-containing protein